MKHQLDADKAREILFVLESATFKTFIEDWITKEQTYQMQQSLQTFSSDDRGVDVSVKFIGRANGLHLCAQRITSLRNLCNSVIAHEVENLKTSGTGGPTDATV